MPSPRSSIALVAALAFALAADGKTFRYKFDAKADLDDFETVSGSWSVSAGNLWCTTKGARDELSWRRELTPSGSAELKLAGAGRAALALRADRQETLVRVDRGSGDTAQVAVEVDGKAVLERPFEPPASGPVTLALAWSLDRIELRVGDDEPLKVARPKGSVPFKRLALLALKSQLKLDELTIGRDEPAAPAADPASAATLTEDERLVLERAAELAKGDPDAAFELLVKQLPHAADGAQAKLPEPMLALLQELGARREALKSKSPLKELVKAATVAARDGSASLVLPLRSGWSAETPEIHQTDGVLFTLTCISPALRVEIYRYDQKRQYWFGRDPKAVLTTGGGGPTLGRARADEQQELHPKATVVRPFEKSKLELGGATTYEHELAWPDPDDATKTRSLRELYLLHRGDTWRVTLEGSPLALDLARSDVDWLLPTIRFVAD